jgi:perosamine synthetase
MSTELKIDFPGIQTRHTREEISRLTDFIAGAKTLTMGPMTREFESKFAFVNGSKFALAVNSATAALELTAIIGQYSPGDEVLLPAHTFTASALPFMRRKCKLVFVDIDPATWLMDLNDMKKKMTSKTKAIVAVHLYGVSLDMHHLMDIANQHQIDVIEDCAQAVGARFKGKCVGTFGRFGCFSFHSQKNITTLGEGGMLVMNSDSDYKKSLGLRKIGSRPFENQTKYWLPAMANIIEAVPGELPQNYALPEPNAFAGLMLLERLNQISQSRRDQYKEISTALSDFPEISFQQVTKDSEPVFHLLPARYSGEKYGKTRDDLIEILFEKYRIKCVTQYYPLYNYELFRNNGYTERNCLEANNFYSQMISIPFWTDMPKEEMSYLIGSFREALNILRG